MKKVEIEVYSETVNAIVARYPGRTFPALLLQGDDLNNMYKFVREIRRLSKKGMDFSLELDALYRSMDSCMCHYEQVLLDNSLELPYRPNVIGDIDRSE